MLFGIHHDNGSSIKAYLIPDSGGTVPSVKISNAGADLLTLDANETIPHIVSTGRHATGRCGFLIDETLIPALGDHTELELREAKTGILIYRRPRPGFIDQKIFRLETHLLPLWRFDEALRENFHYWYKGVDRHGLETSSQVFVSADAPSTYISGRLLVNNIHLYLSKGYKTIAMFRDPYLELAERMIVLKGATDQTRELLGPRDTMTFEVVVEALGEIETFDKTSCKRFFKRASQQVFAALASPFVRLLTSSTPDEMPAKTCMGTALQLLAEFEILGMRSDASHFSEGVGEMLGLDPASLPLMKEYRQVVELGDILREIHDAELLLEQDLELYGHTKVAFGASSE